MDRTPEPLLLAKALRLPFVPGRSAEAFRDGDLELRFTATPRKGLQMPHERDELYIVARGRGRYRCESGVADVAAGDLLFAAAGSEHGFEDFSDDFAIWIIFYGPGRPIAPRGQK